MFFPLVLLKRVQCSAVIAILHFKRIWICLLKAKKKASNRSFFSTLRSFFSYEISSWIEGSPQYEIGCSYSQNSNWANCVILTPRSGSERDSKWMEIRKTINPMG